MYNGTPKHGAKMPRTQSAVQNTPLSKSGGQNKNCSTPRKKGNTKNSQSGQTDLTLETMCSPSFVSNAIKNLFNLGTPIPDRSPTKRAPPNSKSKMIDTPGHQYSQNKNWKPHKNQVSGSSTTLKTMKKTQPEKTI